MHYNKYMLVSVHTMVHMVLLGPMHNIDHRNIWWYNNWKWIHVFHSVLQQLPIRISTKWIKFHTWTIIATYVRIRITTTCALSAAISIMHKCAHLLICDQVVRMLFIDWTLISICRCWQYRCGSRWRYRSSSRRSRYIYFTYETVSNIFCCIIDYIFCFPLTIYFRHWYMIEGRVGFVWKINMYSK